MISLRNVRTQPVTLAMAGTIAISNVLGSGMAAADGPTGPVNLAPNTESFGPPGSPLATPRSAWSFGI
jgi:hypothetical protein